MPQFKKTPKAQSAPDILDSPALMRQSPRQSTKTKLTRVTALGTSREDTDPYVNSTVSLTLLLELERKADLHISIRDEA